MQKLLTSLAVLVLAGCSSTPEVAEQPIGQYCYTSERVVEQDGSVSSKKEVICDDRPKVNHV